MALGLASDLKYKKPNGLREEYLMRPVLLKFALLMLAPSLAGKSFIEQSKGKAPLLGSHRASRSIASVSDIQKDLENTIKEKLDKKKEELVKVKEEVDLNEKDDNCKDELKLAQEKQKKLEEEIKELENFKIPQSNQDLVNCLSQSKPEVLSSAISNLLQQHQFMLSMYQDMQNLLLGYQIQNMYFEISKPTYSDLGQQSLSLNSILGYTPTYNLVQEQQQPLPQILVEPYNFSNESDLASAAYDRMIPDVSRNPMYSPNWGSFSLERGQLPGNESYNFGTPTAFQFDRSVSDVSQNPMYQPSTNGFSEDFMSDIPSSGYNFELN